MPRRRLRLDRLRIMSFNVRGHSETRHPNAWPDRAGLNVETIRHHSLT